MPRWLAGGAVAWGAFAFGSVYPWGYWPLAALCAASGIAGLFTRRALGVPGATRAAAIAATGVALVAAIQLVPLPLWLLSSVSPRAVVLLNELNATVAWQLVDSHAISLHPAAGMVAIGLYIAFASMTFGLARSLTSGGACRLAWVISWIGIVVALAGIVQKGTRTDLVYGLWAPIMAGSPFGPFINRNHFAGWTVMAIPVALGYLCAAFSTAASTLRPTSRDWFLWFASRDASQAVQAGFAVLLMGLALILTMSRSGMLGLAAALIVGGYAAVRRQHGALGRSAVFSCLALASLAAVLWVGADAVIARFAAADTTSLGGRLPIWRTSAAMLRDFWLTGSGLNTYGVATLFYPPPVAGFHLREAHNDYLQLAVEGGVLLAVPALAAVATLGIAIRRSFTGCDGRTYWIRLGAVSGIIAIAIQSVVEFSLQIPANAALFATLCALALHRPGTARRPTPA